MPFGADAEGGLLGRRDRFQTCREGGRRSRRKAGRRRIDAFGYRLEDQGELPPGVAVAVRWKLSVIFYALAEEDRPGPQSLLLDVARPMDVPLAGVVGEINAGRTKCLLRLAHGPRPFTKKTMTRPLWLQQASRTAEPEGGYPIDGPRVHLSRMVDHDD